MLSKKAVIIALSGSVMLFGCGEPSPSNSDVLKALSDKDPLAIAKCVSYKDFKRNNGYKQGDSYLVDYTVTVKAEKTAQECTETLKKAAEGKPEMALSLFSYMMNNLFEIAALDPNKPKTVNGQISMIKSEAGWVERPKN